MRIKKGFILRKVGTDFMAVQVGKSADKFSGLIRINQAGELLWKQLLKGSTEEELISFMMNTYEDLDEETAKADLNEFLETIKIALDRE